MPGEEPSIVVAVAPSEVVTIKKQTFENVSENSMGSQQSTISEVPSEPSIQDKDETQYINLCEEQSTSSKGLVLAVKNDARGAIIPTETALPKDLTIEKSDLMIADIDSFKNLNARLARMAIPDQTLEIGEAKTLENLQAYTTSNQNVFQESQISPEFTMLESPSAPMFEEETPQALPQQDIIADVKPKVQCMLLDEAIKLYGGAEIAAVKVMSEREEARVEAGPISGPEHPLVDLLTTFR